MCGALMTNGVMAADDCSNNEYKQSHPERCKYTSGDDTSTFLTIGGGALAAGIALLALADNDDSSSGGGKSSDIATTYYARTITPTVIRRTSVGNDITVAQLESAISSDEYDRNSTQYDEIQLAYSIARGYDGTGTKIAVFDTARGTFINERDREETQHAEYVMDVINGPIAPNAMVEHYTIANNRSDFYSYQEIGDIIASANGANVYNNSWNKPISENTPIIRNKTDFYNNFDRTERAAAMHLVESVTNAAMSQDAIFVWSAGNDFQQESGVLSAMPIIAPELNGHFVNVVAWDSDTSSLAEYSNICGATKNYCLTAPGTIQMSNGQIQEGTSFSAPVVSAAIAVIRQAWDYLPATQITQILFETATDLGDAGVDEVYGHGMLDLERATRPIGTPTIAISDTVSQPLQIARVSSQIAHNIKSTNPTMAFFDKYGRDFETNVSDNISAHNRGLGFERLRGDDARTSIKFGDMEFGFYRNDMLAGTGFLQTNGDTTTTYIATNKHYNLGNFELFGRTQLGTARPQTSNESVISEFSNIYTASAYIGVRGNEWSLSIGIPDTIVNGTMNLHLANGRNSAGTITYRDYKIDMVETPAIEYTANWRFLTAGFIDNPYGENEFYIFTKTKLYF